MAVGSVERLIKACHKHRKHILIIGDAMTDVYVYGRLSDCQDGCQKFVEESREEVPGGAANAARQLQNWDIPVGSLTSSNHSAFKTRFITDGRIVLRHDREQPSQPLLPHSFYYATEQRPDAILISDYDKGFLPVKMLRFVIDYAVSQKILCVADVKREPELYRGAILKCNEAYSVAHRSNKRFTAHVCTRGPHLPLVYWKLVGVTRDVPCVNHVGAGDCFAAHLTLALAHDFSLEDAAAVAHSAGRVYVQHPHNCPPLPEEIVADMKG